ncbi:hypothetical protein [Chitinophaga sp. CF418]|uniref:hypothetical protein n=1 Tax=Chitinophaga sp. CF418 TaxID=1855287 RepID=UPI000917CC93|nr:hypothetical protein [Chitinophaga sp. CF418]SHN16355.1 hypothetical protein SAMN05216311_10663 [Chitinophaga sp. CF418]
MKISLQVTLYCASALYTYGQSPATQKVFIIKNHASGKSDTIKTGAFIKLWFWSDGKLKMEQPLTRTDFRRHTYYIESVLTGITDSCLIFPKRPPFIPVPIPVKMDSPGFDTVKFTNIRRIRPINKNVDAAAKGVAMLPIISFLPEYFSSSPGIWIMMPGMQLFNTYYGDVVFPYHSVNKENSKYSLYTGEIPADTMYYIQKRKMKSENDYEWEIERLERHDKMYNHVRREMADRLLDTYLSNKVISVTIGNTYIPGAYQTPEDVKTRISIAEKKFYFGIASENFISDRHRVGTEIQMNKTERYMAMLGSNGSHISASTGFILSNFSYFKWGLGGIYSKRYKASQWGKIRALDEEISKEQDETELGFLNGRRNSLRDLLAAEPRPYVMLGIGAVNTTLIKIKGSMGDIAAKDYSQKRLALEAGVGMFTRAGKRLTYDLSVKYVWTSKYDPYIGGLERYSGFRVQINFGYMMGPAFARYKRTLRQVGTNRDH